MELELTTQSCLYHPSIKPWRDHQFDNQSSDNELEC